RLAELGIELPLDDAILTAAAGSPLAQSTEIGGRVVGNRWCIHPMEGWDANQDGTPSDLTLRRWRHFGLSGAKLIWGGEAAAVQADGRANPNQTLATHENFHGLHALYESLTSSHRARFGSTDGLLVGLQLTHSGRYCRPNDKRLEPRIAYHHPLLDARCGIAPNDDSCVWTDADLARLIDAYAHSARLAQDAGFQFVDIKACHGYLLHEFLSAFTRPGPYGGDFEGRTRLLREIIERVRAELPELMVVVRLSAFDMPPFEKGVGAERDQAAGRPMDYQSHLPYRYGFGCSQAEPLQIELTETFELLRVLARLGVAAVNISGGSPYYNPHAQRPAIFPPSDGYQPPEDPLVGVARHLHVARECKRAAPGMPIVATGFSYLQDFLPHAAQAGVRDGWCDFVGLGRMVLSYPELPTDVLEHGQLARKKICRTFSDCTTAPRNGMVSGCYPLDPFYKERPEAERVRELKREMP
ncbi:MAG TPA: NADH:flavin oxidoreductase, partial [Pirellulales bacterium]